MASDGPSSIQTRPSWLNRLKLGDDTARWQEFYGVYGKLVRDFSLPAGRADTKTDEVVQETAIARVRQLPEFHYDPQVCRFKTWLPNQTAWRIKDQLKKRRKDERLAGGSARPPSNETRTDTINRVPEPAVVNLDALFETEGRKNLLATALERRKPKFSLKQIQIFDLHALKEWPAADVAKSLGVRLANVDATKLRIATALRKEQVRLEREREGQQQDL